MYLKNKILILVTGGTGLVGSHLLFDLCKSGDRVRAIKRSERSLDAVRKTFAYYSKDAVDLFKNIEWVDADLMDVYSLIEAMEGVEFVYHCAAMVSFEKAKEAEMELVNVEGTANMVNAAMAAGVKKFCHVSSIATLGSSKKDSLANEATSWKASPDNSNYSITKYAAEREVWRASAEGLDVIIVNPSLIIGGGNWKQSSSNMFSKGHQGIKFYTNGKTGFVDVRDVAALAILLMDADVVNERFILNSENRSYKDFFDSMHDGFKKPKPNIKAGKLLSGFAWRAEKLRCFFSGENPLITKETAQSAHKINAYSNAKVLAVFPDYQFIPVEQSVKDTCELFLKDLNKN